MSITTMAPVFVNNRALFPELDEEQLSSPDWYIEHCRPKLGTDFVVTARELLTEEIHADLEKLRNFNFTNHMIHPISEKRLELLSNIINYQLVRILV